MIKNASFEAWQVWDLPAAPAFLAKEIGGSAAFHPLNLKNTWTKTSNTAWGANIWIWSKNAVGLNGKIFLNFCMDWQR